MSTVLLELRMRLLDFTCFVLGHQMRPYRIGERGLLWCPRCQRGQVVEL